MIVWVASYPRSGNTMLRMMLHRVFGCKTYTKYYSPADPLSPNEEVREATGKAPLPAPWQECFGPMSRDRQIYFVKTHDPPEDGGKAIYLVRNGFAVIRSYQSYLRDFKAEEFSLDQIILGEPQFGSWGGHLDAWNPQERPNTLLLKYEDLIERPEQQIQKLSEFCAMAPKQGWVNEFEKFHAIEPKMFRKGHTSDPSADFSEQHKRLFCALHGDWMQKLRYWKQLSFAEDSQATLRAAIGDRLHALRISTQRNGSPALEKNTVAATKKRWWTMLRGDSSRVEA